MMVIKSKDLIIPTGKKTRWEIWVSRNGKDPEQIGFFYLQHFAQNTMDALNKLKGVQAHLKRVIEIEDVL